MSRVLTAGLLFAGAAMAGGPDLPLPPQDQFTGSSNAVRDDAVLAWTNPAGAAFVEGFLFSAGNRSLLASTGISMPGDSAGGFQGGTFSSDRDEFLFPSFAFVWSNAGTSWLGSFSTQPGGLPELFGEGLPLADVYEYLLTDSIPERIGGSAEIYSDFTTIALGAARRIAPDLGASLQLRYVVAHRSVALSGTFSDPSIPGGQYTNSLDADYYASGVGLTAGLDWRPLSWAGVTARLDTPVTLDYRIDVVANSWDEVTSGGQETDPDWLLIPGTLLDGARLRRDLPWTAAFGVGVEPFGWLRVTGSLDLFLLDAVDGAGDGIPDSWTGGMDAGFSLECRPFDGLSLSAGHMVSDPRGGGGHPSDLDHPLAFGYTGGSATVRLMPSLLASAGAGRLVSGREYGGLPWYGDTSYESDAWVISAGLRIRQTD